MTTEHPTGYLLHAGTVNGRAYVAIATLETANRKTGDMVQIWFLLRDIHPVAAVKDGSDFATVCRDCPFASGKGCYVNVGQAPAAVWKAFHRGAYPFLPPGEYGRVFSGRRVRFGAYGNPTLLPLVLVDRIARISDGWTGYFHDWKSNPQAAEYGRYFMASTETASSLRQAITAGFRVFHVSPQKPAGAIECLSDARGMTCAECRLCNGRFGSAGAPFRPVSERQRPSIWINPHGSRSAAASAVAMEVAP
jgi:hypothetical protein